jgi:hypothetical protein
MMKTNTIEGLYEIQTTMAISVLIQYTGPSTDPNSPQASGLHSGMTTELSFLRHLTCRQLVLQVESAYGNYGNLITPYTIRINRRFVLESEFSPWFLILTIYGNGSFLRLDFMTGCYLLKCCGQKN